MTPSWSLWFYSPLPHPINARTQLWESENLPDIKFYTRQLRVDPHNAKYRLETLSPRYKSPLMDFRTMTTHLEYHRKTQTRYTIRVYPSSHEFETSASARAAAEDAIIISGERDLTAEAGAADVMRKEDGDVLSSTSRITAASEKEKLKLAAEAANALKKGKAKEKDINKDAYQPSLHSARIGKSFVNGTSPRPSSSTSLRMKGRHELGSSATESEPVVSAEVYKHLVWSDSEDDCDDFVWFSDSISDNDPIRAKITRAAESGLGSQSSFLAPTATGASAFTSQPITPPLTNAIIAPGTTRAPLFDQAQYRDLERIIAAATNSVPAGAEEDDLHQRLLSLLESIKPAPIPSVPSRSTDGRMCAKPHQPVVAPPDAVQVTRVELDSDQVVAGGAEPPVKLQVTTDEAATSVEGTSDLTTPSAQPIFDLGNFAEDVKHAVLTALGQGISAIAAPMTDSDSPTEVFVSTCPSPILEEKPPLQPDTPAMAVVSSASGDNLADGILSPNSQKTLKGLYLADLLASPLNTPASSSVLRILEEEDVGLDSSLGLKMLDLARSMRSDGELVERKEKKPEVVKADRTESMLRKVLEKLNDQAGMLNAIAEASGVNLLDEDEDEEEAPLPTVVPPVVRPAETLAPVADPQTSASVNETSGAPAATPISGSADIMATLAEVTASLAILTPPAPLLPLAADTISAGPTAPPTPAASRLAAIAASIGHPQNPFPPYHFSDKARPLPTVEDYSSEADGSITPAVSDAATTRAQTGRGSCRSISPPRNGPPRNPFADPPQFGRSYTPSRPTSTAGNLSARPTPSTAGQRPPATDARDRPSDRAFNEAFARYAADQQAFPSAAAAARNAHTAGASAPSTLAGNREAFYNNVDSYGGIPAPMYYSPHYNPESTRSLFAPSRFGPGAAQPPFFNIPGRSYYPSHGHANPHHHPYHPSHQSAMFGPAPTSHSIFDSHYQPGAGLPDQNQHGAPYMWNQTRESRLSGSSASSFGTRADDEPARSQPQGSFIPGPRQSCWR